MLKNFLIICICICCIMCLFGISSTLSYDTVKDALEDISNHSYFVKEGFAQIGLLSDILPATFDDELGDTMVLELHQWVETYDDPSLNKYSLVFTKEYNGDKYCISYGSESGLVLTPIGVGDCTEKQPPDTVIVIDGYDENGDPIFKAIPRWQANVIDGTSVVHRSERYYFDSYESMMRTYDMFAPMISLTYYEKPDNWFLGEILDLVSSILMVIMSVFVIIQVLIWLVVGFVVIVWDLVRAVLRICGFIS